MKRQVLWLLVLLCVGCSRFGTETGNPFHTGASDTQSGTTLTSSGRILNEICQSISRCSPAVTLESCYNGTIMDDKYAPKLGITTDPPPTVLQILESESRGDLKSNSLPTVDCVKALTQVQCEDPRMTGAYDPSLTQPFQAASELLDPVCAGVFATTP